jgi:membrane associated rhomboid family serine protease
MATCYRHPERETGVSCSSCGRAICPDCMTPTPVGMRCPECARQRTKVHTMSSMAGEPRVTVALIIINVALFVATRGLSGGSGPLWRDLFLIGQAPGPDDVAGGQYYRLLTGGFLHSGIFHIGFNMYLLWVLGQMLEPVLGSRRFAALYFTSLLCGSFGALLLSPHVPTVGASGAVFGLMGAAAVELRSRGINPFQTTIGMLIILNLGLSLVVSNISLGGHVGGLIGGVVVGVAFDVADRRRRRPLGYLACLALAAAAALGAVAVA